MFSPRNSVADKNCVRRVYKVAYLLFMAFDSLHFLYNLWEKNILLLYWSQIPFSNALPFLFVNYE